MPLSVKRYLITARIPHGQITDSSPAVTGVSRAIYQELKAGRGWRGKKKKREKTSAALKRVYYLEIVGFEADRGHKLQLTAKQGR